MPQIGEIGRNKNYMKSMWMACPDCGHEHWVRLYKGKPQSVGRCRPCSTRVNRRVMPNRYGSNNGCWRGGRIKDNTNGYVYIKVLPGDFFMPMADHRRYIPEHRLIMAKHLNRCLLAWEIVHHKNGVRDDNRLENLELLPSQSKHIPSIKWQREINKRDKKIAKLEARIKELEVEKNAS
jgi:hypothetical protein